MSETHPRVNAGTASSATPRHHAAPTPTGQVGWVLFAGCMLIILGAFHAITGLVALFNSDYYVVTSDDLLISVGYAGWGWLHLLVAALVLAAGCGVLASQSWARVVGIAFAGVGAIANLGFMAASPLGSVLLIALDVIVIYALSVHGSVQATNG